MLPIPVFLLVLLSFASLGGCGATRGATQSGPPPSEVSSIQLAQPPVGNPSDTGLLRSLIPPFGKGKEETQANPQYATEEDLLKVVAEFQRVAAKDTYRFPLPKDVTGANVYKATLTRLHDYATKHPGAYVEIIAFTRGRAYEGLHEYEQAISQYQIVSQSKNRLSTEAKRSIEILTRFLQLKDEPISATTLPEYLAALDKKAEAWQELRKQNPETAYAMLAREEEEAVDRTKVIFLLLNRHRLEDGNESIILAYNQLIAKHQESKNIYRYQLEFGDFYLTLAQDYVAQNDPEALRFNLSTFEEVGQAALRLYSQVAQEDGIMEKLEAKGKLDALQAYMARIGRLGR